jgi:hypothetical protein
MNGANALPVLDFAGVSNTMMLLSFALRIILRFAYYEEIFPYNTLDINIIEMFIQKPKK